jgi:regulator of ribonuclease activity A
MPLSTADLYDAHPERAQVTEGRWLALGRRRAFAGEIRTVKCHEDNVLVRRALEEAGGGGVLVVDGGGSLRAALLGDNLAGAAVRNGWSGVVVYGCVRDRAAIDRLDLGVRCLATTPRRSAKKGFGERDVVVSFAGVRFAPGAHRYADEDGILVADAPLT